uniref:Reverse transcriptase domain-containing protein n=1 Tax=Neolamprologus brichardi TaxID=32507 RepID=A0A3Q4I2J5_NEOBR
MDSADSDPVQPANVPPPPMREHTLPVPENFSGDLDKCRGFITQCDLSEKCEFHIPTVSFLGFAIDRGQLRADPAKVKAVVEWPEPKTRKALQKFLGFANFYRKVIRDFVTEYCDVAVDYFHVS